ncbi:S-layer protein [Paenibacillus psychroresistens]|uniref:S-layer protein n=1 Tax=Paenibacillus psychroresistens TaxID=1778678 RepID=A0A6B8RSX5_9BACL|nr:glycosyl hydrolase family 28-related protein [Paenibacillus psychroresistens]QGQ98997.1 S-layer protein [Paenibacillus psychroresistens]
MYNYSLKKPMESKLFKILLMLSIVLSLLNLNEAKADPIVNEVSITLGETPTENGITARAGDNGDGLQTGSVTGLTYWQTNKAVGTSYLYMNVDDAFIYDNVDQDIEVAISYYDEGNGSFSLQYDAQGEDHAFKDAPIFTYGNTHQWKTKVFRLLDGKFANRTGGSDFRINIEGGGINADLNRDLLVSSVTVTKQAKETGVSVKLGATPVENGISPRAGDNGTGLQTGDIGGTTYWQTNKAAGTTYLYMNVEDSFINDNTDSDIQVAITYYDEGSGSFSLQYDALGADNSFKDAGVFTYGDSHQWKTKVFTLLDGKFANRTGGSDFRINIEGGGINADLNPDLKVSKVAVNKVLKDNGVSVKLGETPVEKGISPRAGDNAAGLQTGTVAGQPYWKTNKSIGTNYLYMNADNSYVYQNADKDVVVAIEYYDEGNGSFSIQYDAQGANSFKDAQTVHYGNTLTWKTYSYKLEDAFFSDRTNGADFRIGIDGGGNDFPNNKDLLIASVTVKTVAKKLGKAKVISTLYETNDVVIANFNVMDFGAVGDGVADDTESFLNVLVAAKGDGGGVVFVPSGQYKITENLQIPTGVTLRGDWKNPDLAAGVVGTVLKVYPNKGVEDAHSFLSLEQSSGITNLSIWYPEQEYNNVVAYPWTLEQLSLDNATIENVTLVNAYKGIKIGPDSNELHYIKNLYGTTLKTGIYVDVTTDIGRMEGIHLSPKYWSESLLTGAPSGVNKTVLSEYMTTNSEAIVMGRSDWEYMSDIHISGYKTGMRITTRVNSLEAANAQLFHIYIEECNVALKIEGVNAFGLLITDSSFKASVGVSPKAILATSGFNTIVQFNTVTVGGNPLNAVVNEGTGVLSFENSTIENWQELNGGYAIHAKAGSLILGQTKFLKSTKQLLLGSDVSKVNSLNSGYQQQALVIEDHSDAAELNIHANSTYALKTIPTNLITDKAVRPKPTSNHLYDVTSPLYNAINDGSADVSAIVIQAIADAALTGGTVYFPAGIYRVDQPLVVPAGVELRGMWDVPHHTSGKGSVLFTNVGENAPNGVPFITLQANSGINGISIYYDQQSYSNVKPYSWTIQGTGANVYVMNTTLVNVYQGIDFGSFDTSGHYIDYVGGSPLKEGIFVGGGSQNGILRNVQFNPHYYSRSDYPNHVPGELQDIVWNYQKENLDAFQIGDVENEVIFNTFVYGSKYGIHFYKQNGNGPHATIVGHGTDGSKKGVFIEGADPAGLVFINTELVSMSTSDKVYVTVDSGFDSEATFFNTAMWGAPTRSIDIYGGKVNLQQSNFQVVGEIGVNALGGDVTLYDSYFQEAGTTHIYAGTDINSLLVNNNLYNGGLRIENHSLGKVSGIDLFPVNIEIAPIVFQPEQADGLYTKLILSNLMEQQALNGQIEVLEPVSYHDALIPIHFENLGFGQQQEIKLPFIVSDSLKLKVTLTDGRSFTTLAPIGQSIAIPKNTAGTGNVPAIKLDRKDQYIDIGKKWGGTNDLSATSQVKWDESNLYLSIAVKDNTHFQSWTGGDIWQGDSIQLGIDMTRAAGAASTNVNELGFALKNDGTVTKWRWKAPNGLATGAYSEVIAAITRDDVTGITQYEITLPISSLHAAGVAYNPADPIGFSLLINENDSLGRAAFMEYNHGIGSSKDFTLFGDLHLIEQNYELMLEKSAAAAVNKAQLLHDRTSIDAATGFVNLLQPGAMKQSLTNTLNALNNPIGTPAGVNASLTNSGAIKIKWTAISGATGYNVYRSTSLNGTYLKINTSAISSNSYTNTGLSAGATYYYKVTAVKPGVESAQSNAVFVTLKPSVPVGLNTATNSTSSITITWTAVSGAASYNVYRATSNGGNYTKINTTAVGTNSYTNTGLTAGKTYYYKVSAVNAGGESDRSNAKSAITKPNAPTGVKADDISDDSIKLKWNDVSGAASYNVYRSLTPNGTFTKRNSSAIGNNKYEDRNLNKGTTYYYKITAVNAGGESTQSSTVSETTKGKKNNH